MAVVNRTIREFIEQPGERCMEKVFTFGSKSAVCGALFGSLRAGYVDVPLPGVAGMAVTGKFVVRTSAIVGAFGAFLMGTTCLATQLRDKDDYVNWAIGGGLTGALLGVKVGKVPLGLAASVVGATVMGVSRYCDSHITPCTEHDFRSY